MGHPGTREGTKAVSIKGVLGIIGCYGLSDQVIHLISRDESMESIFIVNNEEGVRFAKKCRSRSIKKDIVLVSEGEPVRDASSGFSVYLWLNPEGLHDEPSSLQRKHREALWKMSDHVDSVLFCYGLCRGSEHETNDMMDNSLVPVTFLTDLDGEMVDDCFAAILGGKKEYLDCIRKNKGTLLATTGYAEGWRRKRETLSIDSIVEEVEGLRYMFRELGYDRILKLDDGTGDTSRFDEDVRTFSRIFDLGMEIRNCELTVFEHSYQLAKERIRTRMEGLDGSDMPVLDPGGSEVAAEPPGWQWERKME